MENIVESNWKITGSTWYKIIRRLYLKRKIGKELMKIHGYIKTSLPNNHYNCMMSMAGKCYNYTEYYDCNDLSDAYNKAASIYTRMVTNCLDAQN